MLSKFYVKQKSVVVIMEMCNDDTQVHHTVLTFVASTIFEKVIDRYDYFGLFTMRSG